MPRALKRLSHHRLAIYNWLKVTSLVPELNMCACGVVGLDDRGALVAKADDGAVRVVRQRVGVALRVRHLAAAMCRRPSRKSNSGSDLEPRSGEVPSESSL